MPTSHSSSGETVVAAGPGATPSRIAGMGPPASTADLPAPGTGDFVERDGEVFYRISGYDSIPPFFMSLVSGWDHWMFLSSSGGLTCGRGNPDNALFPYEPDDKIHDSWATTGPLSVLLVGHGDSASLWKPLGGELPAWKTERNLYKNLPGNRLIFEEVNHDLGLVFASSWASSDRYGFVRGVSLGNIGGKAVRIRALDGLRNLLPWGVTRQLQSTRSTLVDAYKQAEKPEGLAAGVYSLTSLLSDRAEPNEALRATVAWCNGLDDPEVLLSEDQVGRFCAGERVTTETISRGKRGAFLVHAAFALDPGQSRDWHLVADVGLGPAEVPARLAEIRAGVARGSLESNVAAGTARLLALVGSADGCQLSADPRVTGRHFSNTLFNIMRGGVFSDGYRLPPDDFLGFVAAWHAPLQERAAQVVHSLPEPLHRAELIAAVHALGEPDLERLALEYLPLMFSRRHGDPSRPWNTFSIVLRTEDGRDRFNYEGNWRDIFQNWRALAVSFPDYIESFIAKFLNASTPDGHNPSGLARAGFSWETLDPDDAWSNIGYWGDHQVNYLLELLEFSRRYHPGSISAFLDRDIFVYANVPYRIRAYDALIRDPRHSVDYDPREAERIADRVREIGADGQLAALADGSIHRVNLLEKLLVPVLSKIAAFVPGGGIWMNTQRPEWNDANNALAGYGLSMVTLCYLRRFLVLLQQLLAESATDRFLVSAEVAQFFTETGQALLECRPALDGPVDEAQRKHFMDRLGRIGEAYRGSVYGGFTGRKQPLAVAEVQDFLGVALDYLNHTIALNRREDGLFHAYNLIRFDAAGFGVDHLYPMLEGQVAVLNSGFLGPEESVALLQALRASEMYRTDQNSYMLYPDRPLPSFLEKNVVPAGQVSGNAWIQQELGSGRSRYLVRDVDGKVHFNGQFSNARHLRAALAQDEDVAEADAERLCAIYESVFQHRHFTGRSSAMFKYEGLGCIYWHMVSKLLLVTGDVAVAAGAEGADRAVFDALCAHFDAIKDGLGMHKAPDAYGAFPTDPYSHTPSFAGVQQPGMTGQVKEDIVTRFTELGVQVDAGELCFRPSLLRRDEFLAEGATWHYSTGGEQQSEPLPPGSLAFTVCGVPVIYRIAAAARIQVFTADAAPHVIAAASLGRDWSQSLFQRRNQVTKLVVDVPAEQLR